MIITENKIWQNKKWLEKEYSKYGTSTIAKICNRDDATIKYWLNKFGIPLRTRSESLKLKNSSKNSVDENYFDKIDTPEKAYWLGYLMADGTMREYRQGCYQVSLELAYEDRERVHDFAKAIGFQKKIYESESSRKSRLIITNTPLCKRLMKIGILPRKTGHETYPSEIPENLDRDFIRGYFDGDGSIVLTHRGNALCARFHIVCANNQMLYDIQEKLISHCGIHATPNMVHKKYSGHKKMDVYELETANKPNVARIYDFLYPGKTFLARKKKKFDIFMNYYVQSPRVVKRYSPNMLRDKQNLEEIPSAS